jgi:hypothetical protein
LPNACLKNIKFPNGFSCGYPIDERAEGRKALFFARRSNHPDWCEGGRISGFSYWPQAYCFPNGRGTLLNWELGEGRKVLAYPMNGKVIAAFTHLLEPKARARSLSK